MTIIIIIIIIYTNNKIVLIILIKLKMCTVLKKHQIGGAGRKKTHMLIQHCSWLLIKWPILIQFQDKMSSTKDVLKNFFKDAYHLPKRVKAL